MGTVWAAETVTVNGSPVTFAGDGASFTYRGETYRYAVRGDTVSITWPNGVQVDRTYRDSGYEETWSPASVDLSSFDGYLDRSDAFGLLEDRGLIASGAAAAASRTANTKVLLGVIGLLLGGFDFFLPEISMLMARKTGGTFWRRWDNPPTPVSIAMTKGSGGILMAAGGLMLLLGLFS